MRKLRKLKDAVCIKCGTIGLQSAGCSHASCGGIFVAIPHKFRMDSNTNKCKTCKQESWVSRLHI